MLPVVPKAMFETRCVFRLLFPCVFLILGGCGQPDAPDTAATATLRIQRPASFIGSADPLDVYVNENKVGTVWNGAVENLTFEPNPTGRNTLRLVLVSPVRLIGPLNSKTVTFSATQGGVTNVTSSIVMGLWTNTLIANVAAPHQPPNAGVMSVNMSNQMKAVVIKQLPPIVVPFGTDHGYSESITTKHTVEIADHWSVASEVRGNVWGVWGDAQADLKAQIEKSTHEIYGTETTYTPNVVLRGLDKPGTKYNVCWVQYYRTGTATMDVKNHIVSVPFQIADNCDLEAVKAN